MENPRLQRLKEKTLRFNFKIIHVPGVKHKAADATSRHPTGHGEHMEIATLTTNHVLGGSPVQCDKLPAWSVTQDQAVRAEDKPKYKRLSKVFLQNLRRPVTEEERDESLLLEETMGRSMARLAQLSWRKTGIK